MRLEKSVQSTGSFTTSIAALPSDDADTWYGAIIGRVRGTRPVSVSMSHKVTVGYACTVALGWRLTDAFQASVSDRTKVSLAGDTNFEGGGSNGINLMLNKGLIGTVRHQYSPRISFRVCLPLYLYSVVWLNTAAVT